jgi:hypothetical protein
MTVVLITRSGSSYLAEASLEEVVEQLKQLGPGDWVEATTHTETPVRIRADEIATVVER